MAAFQSHRSLFDGGRVWDDVGFRAYSLDILRFSGCPDDRVMQSRFYVFLAVGKLLFGRHEHSQAMQFASGMVGAKPLVVNEPTSLKNLHFDF